MEIKNQSVWILRCTKGIVCKREKKMLATGCVKKKYDEAIFCWHKENTLQAIIPADVDFCWAGTKLFQSIVIIHTENAFTVSK